MTMAPSPSPSRGEGIKIADGDMHASEGEPVPSGPAVTPESGTPARVRNGDDPDAGPFGQIHDEVWKPADEDSSMPPSVPRPSFRGGNNQTDSPLDFLFKGPAKSQRAFSVPAEGVGVFGGCRGMKNDARLWHGRAAWRISSLWTREPALPCRVQSPRSAVRSLPPRQRPHLSETCRRG